MRYVILAASLLFLPTTGNAQVKGTKAGSAEALQNLEKYKNSLQGPGPLKVGAVLDQIGVVMLRSSTKGIADGKFWRGSEWKEVVGAIKLTVTDTTSYKTASGAMKTVFVVLPGDHQKATAILGKTGAKGAAAYDEFIEPVRDRLIQAWKKEIAALQTAIKEDQERLRKATNQKDRAHFQAMVAKYSERLEAVQRNDPPFIDLNALKK